MTFKKIAQFLMSRPSHRAAIFAIVFAAMAGAFFIPSKVFLAFNADRSQIERLQDRLSELRAKLASAQDIERESERLLKNQSAEIDSVEQSLFRLADENPGIIGEPQSTFPEIQGPVTVPTESEDLPNSSAYLTDLVRALKADLAAAKDFEGLVLDIRRRIELASKDRLKLKMMISDTNLQLTKARNDIQSLGEDIARHETTLTELRQESENQYLATRAFALGALGAFAAAASLFLSQSGTETRLRFSRTSLSMVFGGFVSLVVFALFRTREISVFNNAAPSAGETPDYWRVVILCLLAGAFADRLFLAAQDRLNAFTQQGQG